MLRIVVEWEVARPREDLESTARNQLVRAAAVVKRDDRVLLAPDQHRRDLLGEVEEVTGVDPLSLRVDDRARRVNERPPGVGVAQRVKALRQAAHVGALPHSEAPERPSNSARRGARDPAEKRGSTNSAPGNVAARSMRLTSSPRPPLSTSTSRSRGSGNW